MYAGSGVANGAKQYYRADPQGSIIALTDYQGNVVDTYTYDAYGMPDDPTGQPIRYTGRRWDAETGLYYYRARMLSPAIGRFLQTDPVGYGDNVNLYGYVGNDPTNSKDPSGQIECQQRGAAAAACQAIAEKVEEVEQAVGEVLNAVVNISFATGEFLVSLTPIGDAEEVRQNVEAGEFGKAVGNTLLAVGTLGKGKTVRVVIGKLGDLLNIGKKERTLLDDLPDLGSDAANRAQNTKVLQKEINKGIPIRDASVKPDGNLKVDPDPNSFLNLERNLLKKNGWEFNPKTGLWEPPN